DYKDVPALKKLITSQGKMFSRKRSGLCAPFQRAASDAVKGARFMGVLPYVGEYPAAAALPKPGRPAGFFRPPGTAMTDPTAAFAAAVARHQAGALAAAEHLYRELLGAQPDHVAARSNLGALLVRAGR